MASEYSQSFVYLESLLCVPTWHIRISQASVGPRSESHAIALIPLGIEPFGGNAAKSWGRS